MFIFGLFICGLGGLVLKIDFNAKEFPFGNAILGMFGGMFIYLSIAILLLIGK